MNKNQFISFLQNPVGINTDSVALLRAVVKEFPYFQTAQLLYTKILYDQNSIHYSNQLKMAAAYVADRKVLYNLINNFQKQQPLEVSEKRYEVVEEKTETLSVVTESKSAENIILYKTRETEVRIEEKDVVEKKDVQIVELVMEAPEIKNEPVVELPVEKIPELEQDIIINAIDASIKIEVDEEPEIPVKDKFVKIEIEEDIVVSPDSRFSFSDWLKLADPKTPKEDKKKLNYTELIDKFIVHEPKMTRPAATFYSPIDKARKSVTDNSDLVTETLAKIYVKQGNYPKAIKVYESLRLKYPGKSSYFAARIQEIEKLINRI